MGGEKGTRQAESIRIALAGLGWRGKPPVIALAGRWGLAAAIPVASPQLLRKRQAMRYELETAVPWSAEDYACDYVAQRNGAFFVAVPLTPLREFLTALDDAGAGPAVAIPDALLAVQFAQRERDVPADGHLVWRRNDDLHWFTFREGRVWQWRELSGGELRALAAEAVAIALGSGNSPACATIGLAENERRELTAAGFQATNLQEVDWDAALRTAAAALAGGQAEPLVNLRRDELAGRRTFDALRRETRLLLAAAVVLVAAICGALWLRGDAYQQATEDLQSELAQLFEETFPEEPVPKQGVARRFRDEHRKLAATRGDAQLPQAPHADALLERVLAALPTDLRYRVPEIRVEGTGVSLAGEVRSNADADKLAAALRAAGGDPTAPRLQRPGDAELEFPERVDARQSGV